MADLFDQVDFVISATNPDVAFPAERFTNTRVGDQKVSLGNNGALTIPANITGNPAISVPVEPFQGLPVGMQIMGRHHEDALLLDLAAVVERTCPRGPWFANRRRPSDLGRPDQTEHLTVAVLAWEHLNRSYDVERHRGRRGRSADQRLVTPPAEDGTMARQLTLLDLHRMAPRRADPRGRPQGHRPGPCRHWRAHRWTDDAHHDQHQPAA